MEYTSYCLYGSKRHMMSGIFLNRSMPFYQFGDLLWLQKIPTSDWLHYIISHFEAAGRHVTEQIVERICEAVDNYPSYVQHLSAILLSHLPEGGTVTDGMMALSRFFIPTSRACPHSTTIRNCLSSSPFRLNKYKNVGEANNFH